MQSPCSRADMCLNCSLSVKSMKFGMMIVFKALKKDRIWCHRRKVRKIRVFKTAAILNRK